MKSNLILPAFASLALALSACGEKSVETARPADPRLEALFVAAEPAGAISVIEARQKPEPGTEVTVVGRVAGAMEPFSKDFATLVLADNTVMTCEREPGDTCETPWDACCVEPGVLAASRLSVQVNGADGKPLDATLKGVKGLKELDQIVIRGKVAPGSTAENLIVEASGIYRRPVEIGASR
jgi:hypothetical protein